MAKTPKVGGEEWFLYMPFVLNEIYKCTKFEVASTDGSGGMVRTKMSGQKTTTDNY